MALLHPIPAECSFRISFAGQVPENGSICFNTLIQRNVAWKTKTYTLLCKPLPDCVATE